MMNKVATVSAALLFATLWSAPTADAVDAHFDGYYYPISGSNAGRMAAHLRVTGNDGDPSRPTGTITNADGCTIDTFSSETGPPLALTTSDSASGFLSGHVTSGDGPNCQSVGRLKMLEVRNPVTGEWDLNLDDLDNHHSWILKGSQG